MDARLINFVFISLFCSLFFSPSTEWEVVVMIPNENHSEWGENSVAWKGSVQTAFGEWSPSLPGGNNFSLRFVDVDSDWESGVGAGLQVVNNAPGNNVSTILGVIGPPFSLSVASSNLVLTEYDLCQVTPSATSDSLSDSAEFPRLIRVVPPDSLIAIELVNVVKYYGWSQIGLVGSGDDYGTNGVTKMELAAASEGITVVESLILPPLTDTTTFDDMAERLAASGARIVGLSMLPETAHDWFAACYRKGLLISEFVWLGTDGIASLDSLSWNVPSSIENTTLVGILPKQIGESEASQNKSQAINSTVPYSTYHYDTAWVLFNAIDEVVSSSNHSILNSTHIYDSRKSSNYIGATGEISFDSSGDRLSIEYAVYSWNSNNEWIQFGDLSGGSLVESSSLFSDDVPLDSAVEDKVLKIGVLFPFGKTPEYCDQWLSYIKLAVADCNAQSSTRFQGYRFELVLRDSELNENIALMRAVELVEEGVVGVIGAYYSSESKGGHLAMATNHIPQISGSSTSPDLSNKDIYPYFLRTIPTDALQTIVMADLCIHYNWTRVGLVYVNDPYGTGGIGAFLEEADRLGIERVNHITYEPLLPESTADDLELQMRLVKESGARVVILFVLPGETDRVLHAAEKAGITGAGYVWIGSEGIAADTAVQFKDLGISSNLVGLLGTVPDGGSGPVYEKLVQDCQAADPDEFKGCGPSAFPVAYGTYKFDCMLSFADAIERMLSDGQDPKNGSLLLDYLYASDFQGATGRVTYNSLGDRLGGYMVQNFKPNSTNTGYGWADVGAWTLRDGLSISDTITWAGGLSSVPADRLPNCDLGQERDGFVCIDCQPGFETSQQGGLCTPCSEGHYSSTVGSPSCLSCAPGTYANGTGNTACLLCGIGTFASAVSQKLCDLCDIGSYAASNGSTECTKCPIGYYSAVGGSSQCTECPSGLTTLFLGASTQEECVCSPGYYHLPDTITNVTSSDVQVYVCLDCPPGATCSGGDALPQALAGYWKSDENQFLFLECAQPEHCDPSGCLDHTAGLMCSRCEDGYYKLRGRCRDCGTTPIFSTLLMIFSLLVVVLLSMLFLNAGLESSQASMLGIGALLGIFITFLQTLSIFSLFNGKWPDPMETLFRNYLSWIMLDLDVFAPSCVIEISFVGEKWLTFFLPIILLVFIFVAYGLIRLHHWFVHWQDLEEKYHTASGSKPKSFIYAMRDILVTPTNYPLRGVLNTAILFFDLLYIYLLSSAFELFECYEQPDKTKSLFAHPSIECYEGEWLGLLPSSLLIIIVYGIGFPLIALLFIMTRGKGGRKKYESVQMFGYLTRRFNGSQYWWAFILLARKISLAFGIVTFASTMDVQFFLSILIILGSMMIQVFFEPFFKHVHNLFESLTLLIAAFILGVGLTYNMRTTNIDIFLSICGTIALASIIICFFVILFLLAKEYPWPWLGLEEVAILERGRSERGVDLFARIRTPRGTPATHVEDIEEFTPPGQLPTPMELKNFQN